MSTVAMTSFFDCWASPFFLGSAACVAPGSKICSLLLAPLVLEVAQSRAPLQQDLGASKPLLATMSLQQRCC